MNLMAADAGVPAGTPHAIAARVPAETLTAAAPVTGPDGNSWTARSTADAGVPAGTLRAIAARVPAETLTAAAPVTGLDGNSWTCRSAA